MVAVSARTGEGSTRCARRSPAQADACRRAARRRRRAPADRSRVLDEGLRHGRHRHAGVGPHRASTTSWRCCPAAAGVKVRGVQVHGAAATRGAWPGSGPRSISAASRSATSRAAQTLADARQRSSVTRRVDAVLELLPRAKPLKHGARVRVHHGTSEMLGRVSIAGPSAAEIAAGRTRARAAAARAAGGADARRSVHPPRLFAADHDRRRRACSIRRRRGPACDPREALREPRAAAIAARADGAGAIAAMIDGGRPGRHRRRRRWSSRAGVAPAQRCADDAADARRAGAWSRPAIA